MQVLIGAQVDARDFRGYSPAHLAISHGHAITLRALINAGAVIISLLHQSVSRTVLVENGGLAAPSSVFISTGCGMNVRRHSLSSLNKNLAIR